MKTEFLTALGLEQDAIAKIMAENGRDIEKYKKAAEIAQAKLDTATAELESANTTVADMTAKLEEMQKSGADVEAMKKQVAEALAQAEQAKAAAETAQQEATQKLAQRDYDDAVTTYLTGYMANSKVKFSSPYAETGFLNDFKGMGFKLEDGKLLGADDYMKIVESKTPEIFAPSETAPGMRVTAPGSGASSGGGEKPAKNTITFF